jgi:tetratricopeptide (TPR) repeat protein
MAVTFRIASVQEMPDGIWSVRLMQTKEEDEEVLDLIDHFRMSIGKTSSVLTLRQFLFRVGDIEKAERYFKALIKQASSTDPDLGLIHLGLGDVHLEEDDYKQALLQYEKALEADQCNLPVEQTNIANIYNSIGNVYRCQQKNKTALSYHTKAFEYLEFYPSNNPLLLTSTHISSLF